VFFSVVITCVGLILFIYFFAMCGRQLWLEGKLLSVEMLHMTGRHALWFIHLASVAGEHVVSSAGDLTHFHLPNPRLPGKELRR